MGDHAHRQPEEVVRRAHPLRVAPGEVVVDGDDVGAAAGEAVEHRGERRDEGLALAGAHLGDPALVERDGAHQLDVVLAHAHGPLHGLAAGGEHLGDELVEDLAGAARCRACGAPWRGRAGARGRVRGARRRTAPRARRPRGSPRGCRRSARGSRRRRGPRTRPRARWSRSISGWILASSRSLLSKNRERKRMAG